MVVVLWENGSRQFVFVEEDVGKTSRRLDFESEPDLRLLTN